MLVRFAFGTTAVVQDVVSGAFDVGHVETRHGSILYWPLKARGDQGNRGAVGGRPMGHIHCWQYSCFLTFCKSVPYAWRSLLLES